MSAAICAPAARTCELSPRPTCDAPTLRLARVRPGHAPRSSSAVRLGSRRLSVLGITPAAALPRELPPLPRHVFDHFSDACASKPLNPTLKLLKLEGVIVSLVEVVDLQGRDVSPVDPTLFRIAIQAVLAVPP